MRELPILFSTEMVQAILDGRKTMTRRVIKPQPVAIGRDTSKMVIREYTPTHWGFVYPNDEPWICRSSITQKPAYRPGDRLWVRETWQCNPYGIGWPYFYKASPEQFDHAVGPWKSPRFMPKLVARIWLEVTNVRVERLQEITVEDVISEGLEADNEICNPDPSTHESIKNWNLAWSQHVFRKLWDKLNLKRGYGWDANPWVWVIEFKRI